jgi:predicted pyridoxine 5'-phosphate oxidase superfamily flavin-nucleotide-binding protein
MITEELLPALQGAIPSAFATSDKDAVPNVSYLSQVYFVDNNHVAVSNQFLNKSIRNILENGKATVVVIHPATLVRYRLYMEHRETQREGDLFDNMASQLEVIASMMGMQNVFKLNAAEIFEVIEIVEIP